MASVKSFGEVPVASEMAVFLSNDESKHHKYRYITYIKGNTTLENRNKSNNK